MFFFSVLSTFIRISKSFTLEAVYFFLGNKCDLDSKRQITKQEAVELGSCLEIIEYTETSAKDNTNIESSFQRLAAALVENFTNPRLYDDSANNPAFNLGYNYKAKPVGSACSNC